jgi:hypothetical protein
MQLAGQQQTQGQDAYHVAAGGDNPRELQGGVLQRPHHPQLQLVVGSRLDHSVHVVKVVEDQPPGLEQLTVLVEVPAPVRLAQQLLHAFGLQEHHVLRLLNLPLSDDVVVVSQEQLLLRREEDGLLLVQGQISVSGVG